MRRRLLNKLRFWWRLVSSPTGNNENLRLKFCGFGNSYEFEHFQTLSRESCDIFFLQETKLKARAMKNCKYRLGFMNSLAVDCNGRSGSIVLLWKKEVNLSVLSYSKFHIDALIKDIESIEEWYLTGAYGHPNTNCRIETCNLIRSLHRMGEKAWLVFGDFNKILD